MPGRCVIHQVLHEERDPNELPIEVLHASCIRMLTHYALHPSPALAGSIAKMLHALARHRDRFAAAQGADVYGQAAGVWQRIEAGAGAAPDGLSAAPQPSRVH